MLQLTPLHVTNNNFLPVEMFETNRRSQEKQAQSIRRSLAKAFSVGAESLLGEM